MTFTICMMISTDSHNLNNQTIENYKIQRGFPLELGQNENYLFSFDSIIEYNELMKMK